MVEKFVEEQGLPLGEKVEIGNKIFAEKYPDVHKKTITELYKEIPGFRTRLDFLYQQALKAKQYFDGLKK